MAIIIRCSCGKQITLDDKYANKCVRCPGCKETLDIARMHQEEEKVPEYAFIHEDLCIGCTRCIRECSSDAIMGANKLMHTIIIDACHGCGKCVPVCPTDAIVMIPFKVTLRNWHWPKPEIEQPHSEHEVKHAH